MGRSVILWLPAWSVSRTNFPTILLICSNPSLSPTALGPILPWTLSLYSGNLIILTVVDCFSKAVHFNLLSKLPSGRDGYDTGGGRPHLLVDVVSDRGSQYVSIFWREFWWQIGACASLFLSGVRSCFFFVFFLAPGHLPALHPRFVNHSLA